MIKSFDELIKNVKATAKKTVALVLAEDHHALEAVVKAKDIVNAVLIGNKGKIEEILEELGESPEEYEIIELREGQHPSVVAAKLIHEGRADFLMKGKIMTGDMLKGILTKEADLRTGNLMSHLTIYQIPGYHKLLGITDGGMCTYPELDEKKQIITNAINFYHRMGYEAPNVAALCAVEVLNTKMPETADAHELKAMAEKGEIPKCNFEGPISYDLAMVPEICDIKGYHSMHSGNFDILLVPEFVVGNVLGKCLVYTCGGSMAGIVLGCKVPIVLTSRGSSAEEKYYSLALAAASTVYTTSCFEALTHQSKQ